MQAENPLHRNGYGRLADLDEHGVQAINRILESSQLNFAAKTRPIWNGSLRFTADGLYTWSRQWEYAYAVANLPEGSGKVLDAGSGITFFPYFLAEAGFQVCCCDTSAFLEPVFRQANLATGAQVDFQTAGIAQMPYPDKHFDVVCCISVLEHVPERLKALKEFERVLKPGGRLIITCDVSLDRTAEILYEDFAKLVYEALQIFHGRYDLDLSRPYDLLTTTSMRDCAPWRLTFRQSASLLRKLAYSVLGRPSFYHLTVAGLTLMR